MPDSVGSVRVLFPPFFQVSDTTAPRLRRATGAAPLTETDIVLDALRRSDFTIVRDVSAKPVLDERATRASSAATVEVDLAANEDAVVLLEQNGVYSWQTDYTERKTEVRHGASSRTVVFTLDIEPQVATLSLKSLVIAPVRAIIVKFVARIAAGQIAAHLEAKIHLGLVRIGGTSFADWTDIDTLNGLGLEQKEAPRILLFLHGTFSSTRGSFGALTDSAWGKAFLAAALKEYDALIGFDHATLRDDPRQNATELLRALGAMTWKKPPRIDVVTFSRGGLVYRALVEQLLPGDKFQPRFERSIFVAVPNAGTHLADPQNWRDLVDLYTNLAAAVFRLLGLLPQTQSAAFVLSEAIAIVGSLVKSLTDPNVGGDKVPGLAAMSPGGAFIAKLNEVSDTGPTIASTYYCCITSDFEAEATGAPPKEIPPNLWLRLADGFVDRLLESETSDLVIDTKSVPQVDPKAGKFMKQWYEFPANSYVYHTNYFTRPEVVDSLTKWLRLAGGGTRVAPGSMIAPAIPAGFDSDVLLAAAEDSASSLRERIEDETPSYIVVRRWYDNEHYHYAFPAEEVLELLRGADGSKSVREALDLHERGRSKRAQRTDHVVPARSGNSDEREILFADGEPVAVKSEILESAANVMALESAVANPQSPEHRILRRRMMPMPAPMAILPIPPMVRPVRRGGRTRSIAPEEPAPTPIAAPAPASDSSYHFLAQMDGTVVRDHLATIDVTISPEAIAARAGAAASSGRAALAAERTLTLEAFPRRNFVVVGDSRKEIDVASLAAAKTFNFQVKGTDAGSGQVWIIASQGQSPLLTLVLEATIVQTLAEPPTPARADATATAPAASVPAFHKLTIRESERGGQIYLNFELQAPELNLFDQFDSGPLPASSESYVRKLYVDIEAMWVQNSEQSAQFIDQLRAYGMTLFDQLIPLALQQLLWKHRDQLRSIMVVSTEPFLPWEVLFLHEPGQVATPEGRFFGQMGLVRWLYGNWPPVKLRIRKGKTRVIAPDYPPPNALPNAQQELDYLVQKFGATRVQARYSDVKVILATADSFDLLHFACHGENDPEKIDTRLLLENGGELKSMVVSSLVQFGANHRPMIVLNACQVGSQKQGLTTFGGFAKAFLARQAGIFVAPLWSVGDKEATLFSRELYDALEGGKTISEATIAARETTRNQGEDATWLAYAVYGHPHARCEVER